MSNTDKQLAEGIATRVSDALEECTRTIAGIEKIILVSCKCCPNCDHFDTDETCKLTDANNRLRPPARVIAFGCPKFDRGVPF